jgi:Glycine-zipper domain
MPPAGKGFDRFQSENATCRQYAQTQVGPNAAAAPQQNAAASAVVGTLVGAAFGALVGSVGGQVGAGAAIGAGSGLLIGGAAGGASAQQTAVAVQGMYNVAYSQCMAANGNQIAAGPPYGYPGYPPPGYYPPPPPPGYW